MAADSSPRSVADATRFTSNTPHANSKARKVVGGTQSTATTTTSTTTAPSSSSLPKAQPRTASASASAPQPPRRPAPASASASASAAALAGAHGQGHGHKPESLDERVRRLRAAHLAARNHEVSRMDKVISNSRRYMDAAHRYTVMGLIGFSGLALLVTVYATVDMMVYNRNRRNEFFALQQQLQTGSLEAARLAYMTGSATEEQIALVEDATDKAKKAGLELPNLLHAPKTLSSMAAAATTTTTSEAERTVWPGESLQETSLSPADHVEAPRKKGLTGWLFGGLKDEDTAAAPAHLGFEREHDAASPDQGRTSAAAHALGEKGDALKDKAKAAFEAEKQHQRQGGPLDQLGLDAAEKKKGWFW